MMKYDKIWRNCNIFNVELKFAKDRSFMMAYPIHVSLPKDIIERVYDVEHKVNSFVTLISLIKFLIA